MQMKRVIELLFYGGISPQRMREVIPDIDESNRKSVITYSIIALAAFIGVELYAMLGNNPATRNIPFYTIGALVMALLLVLNMTIAKKWKHVTRASTYLFTMVLMGIGILISASSRDEVTATYMVLMFVAPLLFTIRPLYIDIIILVSDVCYILLMRQIQAPELFQTDMVNAIIFGILSIFVSNNMTNVRIQKFATDYMNRILMETDQLTGMLNRRSFDQHIQKLRTGGSMKGIKVCAFDVNGLKKVNDHIGHHAGDELLRGAASCLQNVFSHYGRCYRTGGDEFIAILQDSSPSAEELKEMLDDQTLSFKGTYVPGLSISMGIAEGTEASEIEELLRKADEQMYEAKAAYYRESKMFAAR